MPQPHRKMKRTRSAGGVVFRRSSPSDLPRPSPPEGDVRVLLLQHETGKWMLPKGTIEPGETPEDVARREVAEETGIRNVRIIADLGEEHYVFFWKTEDTYYDKTVHYYLMEFLGGEEPLPQREEGFVRCEWVTPGEALDRIKYKETRQVMRRAQVALTHVPAGTTSAGTTEAPDGSGAA